MHRAHHEGEACVFRLGLLEQCLLLGAHQPQMIGPSALHEAQIVGVIDDAGKIRVLVIDADLHAVAAVADLAVEMRHRRTHWISAANFNDRAAASNRLSRVQIVASTVNIVDASKWASTHPMPNPDNFRLTINSKTSLLLAIVALGRRFSSSSMSEAFDTRPRSNSPITNG